jgi:hypothetical protein
MQVFLSAGIFEFPSETGFIGTTDIFSYRITFDGIDIICSNLNNFEKF